MTQPLKTAGPPGAASSLNDQGLGTLVGLGRELAAHTSQSGKEKRRSRP